MSAAAGGGCEMRPGEAERLPPGRPDTAAGTTCVFDIFANIIYPLDRLSKKSRWVL